METITETPSDLRFVDRVVQEGENLRFVERVVQEGEKVVRKRILQQRWVVATEDLAAKTGDIKIEWRDVPLVSEQAQPQ